MTRIRSEPVSGVVDMPCIMSAASEAPPHHANMRINMCTQAVLTTASPLSYAIYSLKEKSCANKIEERYLNKNMDQ